MTDLAGAVANYASDLGDLIAGTEWYLFGSALKDPDLAADIDLLVLCPSDDVADHMRLLIDPDQLSRTIDLSLLTFHEQDELHFLEQREVRRIFPLTGEPH
jgi:hypothetical protein